MAKKRNGKNFGESLQGGLAYPWNKASRLLNGLWLLLPIFGWFALLGYFKRIVRELILKQNKELPAFGNFWFNFKEGIIIFVFFIPTWIVLMLISLVPFFGGILNLLINIFILPWLVMNFFIKEEFSALWDLRKAFDIVFGNAKEYIIAYVKTIIYTVIYGLLSLVLIGIPPSLFGGYYFLAEFYKKFKK